MREIIYHRKPLTEKPRQWDLSDMIRLEAVDEPLTGPNAKFDVFLLVHGQWERKQRIEFHHGPLGPQHLASDAQPLGINEETLLAVLIDRLKLKGTANEVLRCLACCEKALIWLNREVVNV